MATITLGTNATTSLTALAFKHGVGVVASGAGMAFADVAALNNAIKNDQGNAHELVGGFNGNGLLIIPNRGVLKVRPGDYVGVDSRGWPILLSADTIANGPWTHS